MTNLLHGLDDKILQEYKFCNSYRVNDRVSQYLLKNVIYNGKRYTDEDMLFRILLFKLFNKESTWELLLNNFEDITLKTFDVKAYSKVLESAISNGVKFIMMLILVVLIKHLVMIENMPII